MTINELLETVPAYARDLKLNLSSFLSQAELTEQQTWGTIVASAVASRNAEMVQAAIVDAAEHLSPQALEAAKGAAAVMGMNNVYYRFVHLSSNEKYGTIPARLRMNILRSHGVDPVDFELWCTAVSARIQISQEKISVPIRLNSLTLTSCPSPSAKPISDLPHTRRPSSMKISHTSRWARV